MKLKSFFIFFICLAILIFSLPFPVYAAAAPTVVPFSSLPLDNQNDLYNIIQEILEKLFSDRSHYITVTGDDGKQYSYDYNSAFDQMKAKIDGNADLLQAEIDSQGSTSSEVKIVADAFLMAVPFGDVLLYNIFTTAIDKYNSSSVHYSSEGGRHGGGSLQRPLGDVINSADSAASSIIEESDLKDNGKSLFDRFFSLYNITSVEAIPMEPFTLKLTPSSKPVGDNCFSYAVVRNYQGQTPYLEFYSQPIHNPYYNWFGGEVTQNLSVSSDDFSLTQNGSLLLNGKISQLATSCIYKFYFPTEQDYKDMAWYGNISVTDEDLEALPGINFDNKSDLEKAAEVLAEQLGVDINRILDEFKLIYDENGVRYLESAKGIRTAVDDLISAYNDSIAGNQAIISSLEKLLEQLKAQDISGLESYIASIESTLDCLNQRDKDREAVYGDIVGTLGELRNRLGELNLDELGVISNNIADIKDLINSIAIADEIDVSSFEGVESNLFIDKFPFCLPFDLYRIVTLFVRTPKEPVFTLPIQTTIDSFGMNQSIDEEIILDLTVFQINGVDIVQVVLQFSILVGFVIMLIKITTKLFV